MAARNFPTFATDPTDSGAGTLDAKEFAAKNAANGNWVLENTPVTLAHTGGGSANAIACTSTPAISAYAADQTFWLIPTADNTGAVTIVIDGNASRAVVDKAGSALTGGELVSGTLYKLWDNGTHLRITNPDSSAGAAAAGFSKEINAAALSGASYSIADFDWTEAFIMIKQAEPSGANAELHMRFSDDDLVTDEASGYLDWNASSTAEFQIYSGNAWDNGGDLRGFWIHIIRSGTELIIYSNAISAVINYGSFNNGNAVNGLKIYPDSGTFSAGTITMWAK